MRDYLILHINGQAHRVPASQATWTLTDFLRNELRLTATKVVCAEGDCGSCSVLLGWSRGDHIDYAPVCGCIQRLCQLDGAHVVTTEGLLYDGQLNPLQESMAKCHGAQCGFCTPGFVVTMHQAMQDGADHDEQAMRRKLTGNLCRCTGYEPILKAAGETDRTQLRKMEALYPEVELARSLNVIRLEEVKFETPALRYFKPTNLIDASHYRREHPDCLILAGGTDLGVIMNKRKIAPTTLLSTSGIPSFNFIRVDLDKLVIGGGATLSQVARIARQYIPELADYLEWFGSPQIRNAGTLAGNLATGSPIGDSLPPLMVLGATIELASAEESRLISINDFYTGYRKSVLRGDELIASITIPIPAPGEVFRLYKVSKRKDMDISTFSAAVCLRTTDGTLSDVRIALGGVGPMVVRPRATEAFVTGKVLDDATVEAASSIVLSEITPISDVRGSAQYRNLLATNFLKRLRADLELNGTSFQTNGRMSR